MNMSFSQERQIEEEMEEKSIENKESKKILQYEFKSYLL